MRTFALLLALVGCAGQPAATAGGGDYLTLRTARTTELMRLGSDGTITGPNLQLSRTEAGYRGRAGNALVDLRSDGERIVGTIHDRIVDLHFSHGDEGLVARGLFAGQLGRIEASNLAIKSTIGVCSYELTAIGARYEGQHACRSARLPIVRPAVVELPPGLDRLPADRQLMLLAILLTL